MLGIIIHQLRKEKGWSQLELAKVLNISPSTVGMYEQERRTPDLEILITISRLFDVSLDYLITGTEFLKSESSLPAHSIPERRCCCNYRALSYCPCHRNK